MDQHPLLQKLLFLGFEIKVFFRNLVREFMTNGCQKSAAALTYMTLFALVPMMTVTYSMFSIIPAFKGVADQLESLIFTHFLPESGSEIQGYLADFSSQARNLTGFGVAILLVTAYLMLRNIEKTFNAIWGVKQARRGITSFLLYWAVLSIGPLLLGAGLVISTYLLSLKIVVAEYDQIGVTHHLFAYAPVMMTAMAFTLLFVAVPNCHVPFKHALAGGIVTAVSFELLKIGFSYTVAKSNYKLIYGAFAVVPLFLLWINILWTMVLLGAVFVRTLSELGYGTRNERYTDMRAVLHCLQVFRRKSQYGEPVRDKDCVRAGVSLVHWQQLRSLLVKHKWIVVTEGNNYVLSRDLKSLTLWDVASLVRMPINEVVPDKMNDDLDKGSKSWVATFIERREQVDTFARDVFKLNLDELYSKSTESRDS